MGRNKEAIRFPEPAGVDVNDPSKYATEEERLKKEYGKEGHSNNRLANASGAVRSRGNVLPQVFGTGKDGTGPTADEFAFEHGDHNDIQTVVDDGRRRNGRRRVAHVPMGHPGSRITQAHRLRPDENFTMMEALKRAEATWNDTVKQIVQLVCGEGLSTRAVAKRLGLSKRQVDRLLETANKSVHGRLYEPRQRQRRS